MKISMVTDDTKLTDLGQQDQYCAVGKGEKDACLAVRVKAIIYLYFILLCCQRPST